MGLRGAKVPLTLKLEHFQGQPCGHSAPASGPREGAPSTAGWGVGVQGWQRHRQRGPKQSLGGGAGRDFIREGVRKLRKKLLTVAYSPCYIVKQTPRRKPPEASKTGCWGHGTGPNHVPTQPWDLSAQGLSHLGWTTSPTTHPPPWWHPWGLAERVSERTATQAEREPQMTLCGAAGDLCHSLLFLM